MKILGIDPALTISGWGLIENAPKPLYIAHGLIKTNPRETIEKRLKHIYLETMKVIEEFKPSQMAIEKTFINVSGSSSLLLAISRGPFLLAAAMNDIPITEYTSTHVKKTITGYGHAEKHQVYTLMKFLIKECPEDLTTDASDALAIALTHAHIYKENK